MSIVGVILCFRSLCQDALNDVLTERIPFLLSSISDFKHNIQNGRNNGQYFSHLSSALFSFLSN